MLDASELAYDMGYKVGLMMGTHLDCPFEFSSNFYPKWLEGWKCGVKKANKELQATEQIYEAM